LTTNSLLALAQFLVVADQLDQAPEAERTALELLTSRQGDRSDHERADGVSVIEPLPLTAQASA